MEAELPLADAIRRDLARTMLKVVVCTTATLSQAAWWPVPCSALSSTAMTTAKSIQLTSYNIPKCIDPQQCTDFKYCTTYCRV